MNSEKLNNSISILANVGVIAGILFLAVEIQQNTEMMRSQTRDSMTDKQLEVFGWWATSAEASDIRNRGMANELEFGSAEASQFYHMVIANLKLWENEWYQNEQGLFEDSQFQPRLNSWGSVMQSAGYKSVWNTGLSSAFAPGFSELVDSLVTDN